MAKWLILVGVIFVVVGGLLEYAPWMLTWFGKLPGDINLKLEHGKVYIPITSMLVISFLITLIINVIKRF